MGLLRRVNLLVKASLGAVLKPAEDPRQTFAYAYQKQRALLEKVKVALVDMASAKDRLQAKTKEVQRKLPQLEEQAKRSLIADREDLARLALQRRQVAELQLRTLEQQVDEVEREENRLSVVEQRLAAQIEAFYARHEIIAARYSAAEAQVRINEALGGVSEELADLGQALEKAEQTTQYMQARALAIDELVDAGVLDVSGPQGGDKVEIQLDHTEVADAVEAQLAALKSQLDVKRLPAR